MQNDMSKWSRQRGSGRGGGRGRTVCEVVQAGQVVRIVNLL